MYVKNDVLCYSYGADYWTVSRLLKSEILHHGRDINQDAKMALSRMKSALKAVGVVVSCLERSIQSLSRDCVEEERAIGFSLVAGRASCPCFSSSTAKIIFVRSITSKRTLKLRQWSWPACADGFKESYCAFLYFGDVFPSISRRSEYSRSEPDARTP